MLDATGARQQPTLSNAARAFVAVDAPVIALRHARLIDGTGAPPREDQTLVIEGGKIAAIGGSSSITVPPRATAIASMGV